MTYRNNVTSSVARVCKLRDITFLGNPTIGALGTQYGPEVSGLTYKSRAKWKNAVRDI